MYDNYPPPPSNPRVPPPGERTQERRLINAEEQIEFTILGLTKGTRNFIAEDDPDAIRACLYLTNRQALYFAEVSSYIKQMEAESQRYYGDDKERKAPLQETVNLIQDRIKELSRGRVEPGTAETLSELLRQLRELQRELDEPGRPLPTYLMLAYRNVYKAWVAGTLVNLPYLLEQHVGVRGGANDGYE